MDTTTPMGSMLFTVMAALAQMELEVKRERITDSVATCQAAGKDLGGRRQIFTDFQIRNALGLIESGEPVTQVPFRTEHLFGLVLNRPSVVA